MMTNTEIDMTLCLSLHLFILSIYCWPPAAAHDEGVDDNV
jgi:hypothetical protein